MQVPPAGLDPADLRAALDSGWGVAGADLAYLPVGFGSHHWVATVDGVRRFVTVDELDEADPVAAWDRLHAALRTAYVLRTSADLDFVVAALPASDGEVIHPLGSRFALSVIPWLDLVDAEDEQTAAVDPDSAVDLLARLHAATPAAAATVRTDDLRIEERAHLDQRLLDRSGGWSDGPYSGPARIALEAHRDDVRAGLAAYDRLASSAATRRAGWVVTHGEPHDRNLLPAADGPVLVDWDTALLAPAARDVWMLAGRHDLAPAYEARAGRMVPADELELYRLRWELTEVALYVRWFADPHADDADSETAWEGFEESLAQVRPRLGV